jgi:hypothetical protein
MRRQFDNEMLRTYEWDCGCTALSSINDFIIFDACPAHGEVALSAWKSSRRG